MKQELILGFFILGCASIYAFIGSTYTESIHTDPVGASFYAVLLGLVVGALAVVHICINFFKLNASSRELPSERTESESPLNRRSLAIYFLLLLYVLSLNPLGYLLSTFLLVMVFLRILHVPTRTLLVFSVLSSISSYGIFVFALNAPLPSGYILPDFAKYRYYLPWN